MQPHMRQVSNADLLHVFDREVEVEYREERYRVRDNGSVLRLNRYRKRSRPLDKVWTFGRQTPSSGYMLMAGEPVHRIVCTAFHGEPPTTKHVVDHCDTNRANNRPENLRWVSRLENVLLNPISARRIELVYGSLEAFFEDPSHPTSTAEYPDISWMRTVSADEARDAKERLQHWARSGSVPSGGALGEWLYGTRERADLEPEPEEFESLTPSVVQVRWKMPSEFPCCPEVAAEDALEEYARRLTFGAEFVRNSHYRSVVVHRQLAGDGLVVLTRTSSGVKDWAVAHISVKDNLFYHRSMGCFFTLAGAVREVCELTGEDFDDPFDNYC